MSEGVEKVGMVMAVINYDDNRVYTRKKISYDKPNGIEITRGCWRGGSLTGRSGDVSGFT